MNAHNSRGRKSRKSVADERRLILEILSTAPARPQTREEIRDAYRRSVGETIAYNTAKARLDELVADGRLQRSPQGRRPVTYVLARQPAGLAPGHEAVSPADERPDGGIPLSADAQRVLDKLRRPRTERTPVTYDPSFLDAYAPGHAWYLPRDLRERLRELGSTTYAGRPAGTYARDIMQRLIIDLSWGSSRLEGLKYSRIDTAELLEAGRSPAGASDKDRQLILNHKAAIEFLVENAEQIAFDRHTILSLHGLLAENLLGDPDDEARLRRRPIGIGDSVYTPTAIPQVIDERFNTILEKAGAIPDPMEQAFFVMVHLPYLQPFIDVNKRTSRLAANIPLIKANLCPLSFVDVPERAYTEGTLAIYELRDVSVLRDVFAWAYERSCAQFKVLRQAMGEPDPIRLKYRNQLRSTVAEVVRSGQWPSDSELAELARRHTVGDGDVEGFVVAARRDLHGLRAEILVRYSLRSSEFDGWAHAVSPQRGSP